MGKVVTVETPHYASHPSTESHPNPNINDTPRDFTRGTMVKLNLCSVLTAVRVDPKINDYTLLAKFMQAIKASGVR